MYKMATITLVLVALFFAQSNAGVITEAPVSLVSDGGFKCGGTYIGSGYIETPNFPDNYDNDINCLWLLKSAGPEIYMDFIVFDTEPGFDTVTVSNAAGGGLLLDHISGTRPPFSVYSPFGNQLIVSFTSDGSNTAQGFRAYFGSFEASTGTAEWTTETTTPPTTTVATETTTGSSSTCGSIVTGPSGTITSPDYPSNYANNLDCTINIQVAAGSKILLHFTYFTTEIGNDFIVVYDGPSTSSFIVLQHSGSTIPADLTSSSNQMTLRFITNAVIQQRGWSATYSSV